MENKNLARFLLTFFLGWIGSLIINHSSLKVEGWTSRTGCYILLTIVTFGIYQIVASICNLTFDASKPKNIGYKKDAAQACFSREPLRRTASHCARQSSFVCRFPPTVHPAAGKNAKTFRRCRFLFNTAPHGAYCVTKHGTGGRVCSEARRNR